MTINNKIIIPCRNHEIAYHFSDLLPWILKIIIENNNIYNQIWWSNKNNNITEIKYKNNITEIKYKNDINNIHSKLKIKYGSFWEELPEQKIVAKYLIWNEKVLEIGGNIGKKYISYCTYFK